MSISDHPTALLTGDKKAELKPARRRRASTILLFVGAIVILWPILTEVYGSYVQYQLKIAWDRQLKKQENEAQAAEIDQTKRLGSQAVETEDAILETAVKPAQSKKTEEFPATKIIIPKIAVEQVVQKDVDPDSLKSGPGHYPGTANPGKAGIAGIAGHRVTYTHPFNRLDELKPGDKIFLETLENIFEYRVLWSKTLDPDDLSALVSPADKRARLTLTTCTPKYSARYRLDVQAALVKTTERQKPTFLRRVVGRISRPIEAETTLPHNLLDLAVSQGREEVAKEPNNPTARIYLGAVYRSMGRYKSALFQLNKALEIDRKQPLAHYQLALVYLKTGKKMRAVEELNKAISLRSDFENAYYRLGILYMDLDQHDQAVEVFKTSLAINPISADTHYFLGKTYEEINRPDLAIKEYAEAVKFVPDFSAAKSALRRLTRENDPLFTTP